jgi:uncharacterized RDD family membrane protein YckC
MKCPKCGYVGFEDVNRCRNCGYEFSLAAPDLGELTIRSDEAREERAFDDLALVDASAADAAPSRSPHVPAARPTLHEPTLFDRSQPDDEPLIRRPSPPRTPLSVRRATPEIPRLRTPSRSPMLDLAADGVDRPVRSSAARIGDEEWVQEGMGQAELEPAAVIARVAAAAIDLVVLLAIDIVVVYFTMQICGLTRDDLAVLPKGPLLAFLLVQNGGYLITFTVGGQTLGKMATGIKVVPAHPGAPLDLGHSVLRTLVWAVLAVPAGLGFLTTLFSSDRRGLHDRCAGTRVVRASA